jgi:hypothetical protein
MRVCWLLPLLLVACEGGRSLPSPVVRVDLRPKLPPTVQRRIAIDDSSYECRRRFAAQAGGASQRFVAVYRVLDDKEGKFVTAVQVEPDGEASGASSPEATAVVGEVTMRGRAPAAAATAPLRVSWSARQGCGTIRTQTAVDLVADDPGCKAPALKTRLLTPVK